MIPRYIANITIEATTPLKVGSVATDFFQDAPIQRDWNGLPMILGTSIAGVLRSSFERDKTDEVFGKDDGSKVLFSNALLVDENDRVTETFTTQKSDFLRLFDNLPIREHTAITDKGVAKEHSKFDEEVVYTGSRFRFTLEMLDDRAAFDELLALLSNPTFRLGGGTTKGFGAFKVVSLKTKEITTVDDLAAHSASLNEQKGFSDYTPSNKENIAYTTYTLQIEPENFFIFGSGFGDDDADMTPILEEIIDYETNGLSQKQILIPASSIKGALSHRTAFHYNRLTGATIENAKGKTGEENEAVKTIFGHKKEQKDKKELGQKGKVLMSDCYKPFRNETKVFDHVAIDRFTGGAIEGALFQEKTIAQKDLWEIEIYLENIENEQIVKSFELALKDITTGMLPLGGAVTKGHGAFVGKLIKDGVQL